MGLGNVKRMLSEFEPKSAPSRITLLQESERDLNQSIAIFKSIAYQKGCADAFKSRGELYICHKKYYSARADLQYLFPGVMYDLFN